MDTKKLNTLSLKEKEKYLKDREYNARIFEYKLETVNRKYGIKAKKTIEMWKLGRHLWKEIAYLNRLIYNEKKGIA